MLFLENNIIVGTALRVFILSLRPIQSCFVCSTLVGGRICAKLPRSLCRKSLFSPTKRKVHSQLTLFLYRFSVTPSVRTVLRNSVECNSDSYLQFYVLSSSSSHFRISIIIPSSSRSVIFSIRWSLSRHDPKAYWHPGCVSQSLFNPLFSSGG